MKNIMFYVSEVGNKQGYENIVSAHIQHPLQTLTLLQSENETIGNLFLVTNSLSSGKTRPSIWSKLTNIKIILLEDIFHPHLKMSDALYSKKLSFGRFIKHLRNFYSVINGNDVDILHFWGGLRVLILASIFKKLFPQIKVIHTITVACNINLLVNILSRLIDKVIVPTQFQFDQFRYNSRVKLLRPPIKVLENHHCIKKRVTFWRDPTYNNGADIAQNVFENLSADYPELVFTFAVRENSLNILSHSSNFYDNVEYFEVPYPSGVTIDRILSESCLIFLPFRKLTTHPQLAVIESAIFEVPVITSKLDSNVELSNEFDNIITCDEGEYEAIVRNTLDGLSDDFGGLRDKILCKFSSNTYISSLVEEYHK